MLFDEPCGIISRMKWCTIKINSIPCNAHINGVLLLSVPCMSWGVGFLHDLIELCSLSFVARNSCSNPVYWHILLPFFRNTAQFIISRFQRVQKIAIKTVFNLKFETPSKSLYENYPTKQFSVASHCRKLLGEPHSSLG